MKKIFLSLACMALPLLLLAQTTPVKVNPKASRFVYMTKSYNASVDTSFTFIHMADECLLIQAPEASGKLVPGYAREHTVVDLRSDSVHNFYQFDDDTYVVKSRYSRSDIEWECTKEPSGLMHYVTSINSNRLEVYVQPGAPSVNPIPYYGRFDGLVLSFWRNGQVLLQFHNAEKVKALAVRSELSAPGVKVIGARDLGSLKKQRMIITQRLFDDVQLCWGKQNAHIEGDYRANTPFDSVLHFAGGTLALKRVVLPKLPSHYQSFVEIHQRSNGDAYDRTGSLFVIPGAAMPGVVSFFDGVNNHPDSLPIFVDRNSRRYQGIVPADSYRPIVELVRFFTSFGVGHFNDRMKGFEGHEWEDENYYKQEVTDLAQSLEGEVWVGVWIGNYDGGGHRVTVDLKSYPNDEHWDDSQRGPQVISLFNTTNVLEMAGQNYGQLFDTDSIRVSFFVPEQHNGIRLRLISTGHGGWDGGDEFNPKTNSILVDGELAFTHTPWRGDCARYREWNPVSGNFWNGVSSCDLSRSGWCPGTATQPVYFDLSYLAPGVHTLTLAIPQGAPLEGSISHWCVSGALLID